MRHPEQTDNEVFVGNVSDASIPQHVAGLRTARIGAVAYDIHGNVLPSTYRPLFIGRGADADEYDRTMMARLSRIRRGLPENP